MNADKGLVGTQDQFVRLRNAFDPRKWPSTVYAFQKRLTSASNRLLLVVSRITDRCLLVHPDRTSLICSKSDQIHIGPPHSRHGAGAAPLV